MNPEEKKSNYRGDGQQQQLKNHGLISSFCQRPDGTHPQFVSNPRFWCLILLYHDTFIIPAPSGPGQPCFFYFHARFPAWGNSPLPKRSKKGGGSGQTVPAYRLTGMPGTRHNPYSPQSRVRPAWGRSCCRPRHRRQSPRAALISNAGNRAT